MSPSFPPTTVTSLQEDERTGVDRVRPRENTEKGEAPYVSGGNLCTILQASDVLSAESGGAAVAAARVEDAPSLRNEPEPFEEAVQVLRRPRRDAGSLHREIRSDEMNLNQERLEAMADPVPASSLTTAANTSMVDRNAEEMHHRPSRESPSLKSRTGTFISELVRGRLARTGRRRGGKKARGGRRASAGPRLPAPEAPPSYFRTTMRQVFIALSPNNASKELTFTSTLDFS